MKFWISHSRTIRDGNIIKSTSMRKRKSSWIFLCRRSKRCPTLRISSFWWGKSSEVATDISGCIYPPLNTTLRLCGITFATILLFQARSLCGTNTTYWKICLIYGFFSLLHALPNRVASAIPIYTLVHPDVDIMCSLFCALFFLWTKFVIFACFWGS